MEREQTSNINFAKKIARKVVVATLSPIIRSEVTDNNKSIDKAKEILKSNQGIIIVSNHFAEKDSIQAISEVFRYSVINSKKFIAPIAYHQYKSIYHLLETVVDLTVKPIVTESTIEKGKNNNLQKNAGMKEYVTKSVALLKKGGIVFLFPQGTRMSHLGQPDSENLAVGTLMATADAKGIENYGFLFIGLGIKKEEDYSKKTGFNLFEKYTVNMGNCLTNKEILTRATILAKEEEIISKESKSPFKFVDKIVYEELRKVVPNAYK